jgi:hypothetical protein
MHVPLFVQGMASHGSSSISQNIPSNPLRQSQVNAYPKTNPSMAMAKDLQLPLFIQGMAATQGSTISLHVGPERSKGHSH